MTSGLFASEYSQSDSTRIIKPKAALIRSAIIPGWGHLYVKKPAKSFIYFTLEAYHVYQFIEYNSIYQYVKETKNTVGIETWSTLTESQKKDQIKTSTGYEMKDATWRPREMRNKYAWWCVGFYFIGMLDAFVDAHLYYFPSNKIELSAIGEAKSIGMTFSWNLGK
ncbi:MAG: hypothetical protein JXR87_02425 [Candidatus Marinimicrobia bacterium]|nr:hypothetical protein [Candidatus Neomarinimicrobiota bacterium]